MSDTHARRPNLYKAWPAGYNAISAMEAAVAESGLDQLLIELVKTRCSQINGCAYCIDMHTKDARARGETEQRLYGLSAWRETPYFSEKERAALALAEAVTLVSETHIPDDVFNEALHHFGEEDLAKVMMLIVTINGWNRLALASRTPVGGYISRFGQHATVAAGG
ncbi:MAG: carboxymuconolactone decarboxylase family protein [Chloroflexi bacterium]|nr:carboxymuconolactone decarboxylase family protein [Chloroflexota bacterium]